MNLSPLNVIGASLSVDGVTLGDLYADMVAPLVLISDGASAQAITVASFDASVALNQDDQIGSLSVSALPEDVAIAISPFYQGPKGDPGTGGGSSFLPAPDRTDETDATFFYFGWENVGGDWLVQRQTRSTGVSVSATGSNNPSYADLTAAFPDRATLTYA